MLRLSNEKIRERLQKLFNSSVDLPIKKIMSFNKFILSFSKNIKNCNLIILAKDQIKTTFKTIYYLKLQTKLNYMGIKTI